MTRTRNNTTQASAATLVSAGMLLATGASAQAPKGAAPAAKAPATPMVAPLPGTPAQAGRSTGYHIKFANTFMKWQASLAVAGMLNGGPVFKTPQGEFFQVEPNTGDLKWMSPESLGYIKVTEGRVSMTAARSTSFIKFDGIKGESRVSVLGVDAQGRVLQQNSRGETFYLSPMGDMVFVK
ncbi:MAG: hypothetical protein IT187_02215 [Geothrix sp.]|jgi:outer membrane protein assembly factor BamB|nr:hypothetical protein [Holophagaceae bacterium]MCC6512799.1 hypothetical protein [Geothrix sp.]